MEEDIPAAVAGDPERQLAGPPEHLADSPMPPARSDQKQKASAAGPEELAAGCSGAAGRLVPLINVVVANAASERPF
jgi:hypothetical protein